MSVKRALVLLTLWLVGSIAFAADWPVVQRPLPRDGKLVIIEDHRTPMIQMVAMFPVGSYYSWWQARQMDLLWSRLVVPQEPESAAFYRSFVSPGRCGLQATFLRGERDMVRIELRDALRSDLQQLDFNDGRLLRQGWRKQHASPEFLLDQALARSFFARRDPRRAWLERPRGRRLDPIVLVSERSEILRLPGWVVGVAGDISPTEAELLVNAVFSGADTAASSLPARTRLAPLRPAADRDPVILVRAPHSPELMLSWARESLIWGDPALGAAVLADAVVQRRLRELVRAERGDTYAVYSDGLVSSVQDLYYVATTTSPERAPEHVAAIDALFAEIHENGLTEEEVERARRITFGQMERELHSPADALEDALVQALSKEGELSAVEQLRTAQTVPFAEVDAFARQFFDPAAWSRISVGPRGALRDLRPSR